MKHNHNAKEARDSTKKAKELLEEVKQHFNQIETNLNKVDMMQLSSTEKEIDNKFSAINEILDIQNDAKNILKEVLKINLRTQYAENEDMIDSKNLVPNSLE